MLSPLCPFTLQWFFTTDDIDEILAPLCPFTLVGSFLHWWHWWNLSCHIGRNACHLFVSYLQTNRSNISCQGGSLIKDDEGLQAKSSPTWTWHLKKILQASPDCFRLSPISRPSNHHQLGPVWKINIRRRFYDLHQTAPESDIVSFKLSRLNPRMWSKTGMSPQFPALMVHYLIESCMTKYTSRTSDQRLPWLLLIDSVVHCIMCKAFTSLLLLILCVFCIIQ